MPFPRLVSALFLLGAALASFAGGIQAATTSPSPTVSLSAPKIVTGTVTVSASATESGGTIASVQFEVDGTLLGSPLTLPPYQISWDSTTVPDGSHVLTAVATDAAGVSTSSLPVSVTVANTTVAPTVSITAPANGASVSGTVTVSASATDTSGTVTSVQFFLDGNSLGVPVTAPPYQMTWDTTTATNGSHTLTAQANNNAGQDTTSAPVTVTVSGGVVEPPPTVALVSPTNGAVLTGIVTFAATADQVSGRVTSVLFLMDGIRLRSNIPLSPYEFGLDTTIIPNGSHVFTAVATNDTGETTTSASVTATVNNPPQSQPTVAITWPLGGDSTHGKAVSVAVSAFETGGTIASVQLAVDGTLVGAPLTTEPYQFSWDSTTVSDGDHFLTAVATDGLGRAASSAQVLVAVDNSAPPAPVTVAMTSPANGASVSGTVTVSASATDTGGTITSVQFLLDGSPLGAPAPVAPYQISWDTTAATNGSHTLTAVTMNAAGQSSSISAPVTVTVNNAQPSQLTVRVGTPVNGMFVSGTSIVPFSVTDTVPVTGVQFNLDGVPISPVLASTVTFDWDSTLSPDGAHDLTATATDQAGNSATSAPVRVYIVNPPFLVTINFGTREGGIVPVTATVTDSASITSMQYFFEDTEREIRGFPPDGGGTVTQAPYLFDWNTNNLSDAVYGWVAIATDSTGKQLVGGSNYDLLGNPFLMATITAPANDSTVSGTVTVSASTSDSTGNTVISVQFELDNAPLGAPVTTPPFQITWDTSTVSNGSHVLNAVPSDTGTGGSYYTSAPVTVTVINAQPSQLTVQMNSPTDGSVVSGTIILHASTTDGAGVHVAGVQFNLDGVPIPGAFSTVGAASWDTTQTPNGVHILTATATDQLGNTATSAPVTVTVSNNVPPPPVPPTVSMTSPANSATVSGTVALSAGADDTSGTVTSVQFLLDGSPLGAAVTVAPYQLSWDSTTVPNGSHTLAATAVNNAGQSTTSAPVTVTVANNVAPPPPTVSITSPTDQAALTGVVTVAATAADAAGTVTSVQFMLDGAPLGSPMTASPYQFSWDTTRVPNGSHVLTAVAVNNASESTTSAPVTVTVSNVTLPPPPTVALSSPADGATVSGNVKLVATAADTSGTVTQVQFFLNGSALGAPVTAAPYMLVWHTRKYENGSDVLTAVATNDSGETTISAPVSVTVANKDCARGACSGGVKNAATNQKTATMAPP